MEPRACPGSENGSPVRTRAQRSACAGHRCKHTRAHASGFAPQIFSLLGDVLIVDPQSDISTNAGGTGPFKLDNFTPANEMNLVRNTRYWRPGRPFLDSVTIQKCCGPELWTRRSGVRSHTSRSVP